MLRDDALYLNDIRQACQNVTEYSKGFTKETFFEDGKSKDAVLHNLSVIGEAVKRLSLPLKQKHSDIDWRKIAGLRDVIVHEYFGLDFHILWDIISVEVPRLASQLKNAA